MNEELAARIRSRLEAVQKTATGASREAGLGRTAIHNILSGASDSPRMITLKKLSVVLDCSLEFLMGTAGTHERDPSGYPFRVGLRQLEPQVVEHAITIQDDMWSGSIEPEFLELDSICGHNDLRVNSNIIKYFKLGEHGWQDECLKKNDILFTVATDDNGPLRIYEGDLIVAERKISHPKFYGASLYRVSYGSSGISLVGAKSRVDITSQRRNGSMRVGEHFEVNDWTVSIVGLVVRVSRGIEFGRPY